MAAERSFSSSIQLSLLGVGSWWWWWLFLAPAHQDGHCRQIIEVKKREREEKDVGLTLIMAKYAYAPLSIVSHCWKRNETTTPTVRVDSGVLGTHLFRCGRDDRITVLFSHSLFSVCLFLFGSGRNAQASSTRLHQRRRRRLLLVVRRIGARSFGARTHALVCRGLCLAGHCLCSQSHGRSRCHFGSFADARW